MRKTILVIILFAGSYSVARAEYVFMKNGQIVQGNIIRETAEVIDLKLPNGSKKSVNQTEVLRAQYGDIYLGKQFVQMTNGDVLEGYVVAEEQDTYTFRRELNKPEEVIVSKEKVLYISRNNPSELAASIKGTSVSLSWIAPRSNVKEYRVFLRAESEKYPSEPYCTTQDKSTNLAKLAIGKKYFTKVVAIFPDGIESLPSNECTFSLETLPPEGLSFKKEKEKGTNSVVVALSWKEPFQKPVAVKKYSVYQKTDVGYRFVGETENTRYLTKGLDAKNDYTFTVRTVNINGGESEPSIPVFTGALDRWYLLAAGIYSMPSGYLLKGFNPGGGIALSCMNSYDSLFHFGLIASCSYLPAPSTVTAKSLFYIPVEASCGFNFKLLGTYLIFQPYLGAGYALESIKWSASTTNSFDPVVTAGIRLPFRAGAFIVPFVEYKLIPDNKHLMGLFNFGVGVSL